MAVRPFAELGGDGLRAGGPGDIAPHQRPHPSPQRHVPQVQRLPELLGDGGELGDVLIGARHLAELQVSDQPQPVAEQLELPVAGLAGQRHDLACGVTARLGPVGTGAHVAVDGQRVSERRRVASIAGELDRLLGERLASCSLAAARLQRHAQAGEDPRPQRPLLGRSKHAGRLLQQRDLQGVVPRDLEAAAPGAKPQRSACQLIGVAALAGNDRRLAERLTRLGKVAGGDRRLAAADQQIALAVERGHQPERTAVPVGRVLIGKVGEALLGRPHRPLDGCRVVVSRRRRAAGGGRSR